MSDIRVKICGLRETNHIAVAAEAGADYLGMVFYPPSPRAISVADAAEVLAPIRRIIANHYASLVAVVVDADDALLQDIVDVVKPDALQFHGTETPERIKEIRHAFRQKIIKALPVASAQDLQVATAFSDVADMLLLDAPAPDGVHGGTGKTFDWKLLKEWEAPLPWLLSGGLTPENVADAIRRTGATMVDVSSGVERAKSVKDETRIRAFLAQAKRVK